MSEKAIHKSLKHTFGFSSFKPHQKEIVEAIVSGRDVFAVLPTGGGKSLCYQLPAVVLDGLTVVISPLVALMKDQVDSAIEIGIQAAYLNSSLTSQEASSVYRQLESASVKLLYISPERFALDHFSEQLAAYDVRRFAVDEAHCLSEWGHDFRPDYLNLSTIREAFPDASLSAFTATATVAVQKNIIDLLQLRSPHVVRASFNREELRYRIITKDSCEPQILEIISRHEGESGIVYRTSRASTEKTADFLARHGVKALPYHAGLDHDTRIENQNRFKNDDVDVIAATIAFGMGIDKPDIRFVIHGDLPRSLEGYYQETGRAGRDGLPAECVLIFSTGDISKVRYHIDRMTDEGEQERAGRNLNRIVLFCTTNACRRYRILDYFGEDHPDSCGNCDVCLGEIEVTDASEDAKKVLSAMVRTGERFGAAHVVDVVCGADTAKIRKFGHQHLPTWGVGKDHSKTWWRGIVDELLAQDCLTRDAERFNALRLTQKGRDVMYGRTSFHAARRAESASRPKAKLFDATVETSGRENVELFERLRELRKQLAREKAVPPYVIFSDKTLRDMCRIRPASLPAMLRVSGVGERKLAAYGKAFLDMINIFSESEVSR